MRVFQQGTHDFMSFEVLDVRYDALPSPSIMESHFNEMKKRVFPEAKINTTPSKSSGIVEGGNLSLTHPVTTPPRNSPVAVARKSTPTKDNSLPIENNQGALGIYSTPAKITSTPNQNNPTVVEGSPGIVGDSDPPEPCKIPLFYYNYLHDLESIWWVLIWFLLKYEKAGYKGTAENYITTYKDRIKDRMEVSTIYFQNLCRREDLRNEAWEFRKFTNIIPEYFKGLVQVASIFREKLASTYKEEEGKVDFPIKLKDGGLLHQDILDALRSPSIEYFDVVHINILYSRLSEKKSKRSKRSIDEDSEEERPSKRAR